MAMNNGLCTEHAIAWGEMDKEAMVRYYVTNPDWCLERQFPPTDFMQQHADDELLAKHGVYINKDFSGADCVPDIVILNNCRGTVEIKEYRVARVYVALNSNVTFKVGENAILFVDMYDDSSIVLDNASSSKANIYKYNKNNKVSITNMNDNIKVINKQKDEQRSEI